LPHRSFILQKGIARHKQALRAGFTNRVHTNVTEDEMAVQKKAGSRKKSSGRKYGKAAGRSVESAVRREKKGTLRSGKGGKGGAVKSRKQAIAIGLSEARKKGVKVPKKPRS
jgi:hypothetical protein